MAEPSNGGGAMASSRADTSGFGNRRASSCWTSALVWYAAAATSSAALAEVRWGVSSTTALRCSRPSATALKITGNRRAVRAARMCFMAACSHRCSSPTQYAYIEGNPAGR